jgi:PAS domain S-box-containing protein
MALLEMQHGRDLWVTHRREHRRSLIESNRQIQLSVNDELSALSELGQRASRYVALLPATQELARSGPPSGAAARAYLRGVEPFLRAHPEVVEVRIHDRSGFECLRIESSDGARRLTPRQLLSEEPALDRITAFFSRPQDAVEVVGIEVDADEPTGRLLVETTIRTEGLITGLVVVAVDVTSSVQRIRTHGRAGGVHSALVDELGRYLVQVPGLAPGLDRLQQEFPMIASDEPRLLTFLPRRDLERLPPQVERELLWILYAKAALIITLILWGGIALRISIREMRLGEMERYARRIEKESQKYRALMEGAADTILIIDPATGLLREWNGRARQLLGLVAPGTDAEELTIADVLEPEARARFDEAVEQARLHRGEPSSLDEIVIKAADGRPIPVEGRLALIELDEHEVIEASLRDLSGQKEIERQLQISERLSMVGLMTAGVAHEINNPLEGIGNYLNLLRRDGLPEDKRARYVESVQHGFDRIRDIVSDLSAMAQPEPEREGAASRDRDADLREVVEQALRLLAHTRDFKGVEVERSGLDDALPFRGDPGRIEQVLINLLLNAARAMEGKGTIRIDARRLRDPRGIATVELSVTDQGPGIPPEHLEQIFDPFFTRSGGSGLGLFVSYGIVRAHDGTLAAENVEPHGARFTLRLPLVPSGTGGAR